MKSESPVQDTLNAIMRALQAGGALALVLSLVVAIFGLIAGWRTATEYSNGMFAMGSAVIIFGLLAVWGGFTSRGSFQMVYPQSVSDMSLPERARLWMLDSLRGYQIVGVMTVCGALMIGLSVLIYELFG